MSVTLDVDDEPIPGLDADGRPDSAYAAKLGLVPAPVGRRSAAFALDAVIWAVLATPNLIGYVMLAGALAAAGWDASAVTPADIATPLILVAVGQGLVAIFGLVQLILHGRMSCTIGKLAFGLRSVNVVRFDRPGFWRVVLRALVLWAAQVILPFVGPAVVFASSSWDPEGRGRSWLDRIGRCYVIDVRRGLNPLDAKALRHARRALDTPTAAGAARLPSLATDRPIDEHTFIPSARSSSGVVSDGSAGWAPPPLGPAPPAAPAAPAANVASAAPIAPPAPVSPAAQTPEVASFALAFDDGARLTVRSPGLIGRDPAPAAEEDAMHLVRVTDEQMRISKTHLAFGADDREFWVVDRASTNGTIVEVPGAPRRRLEPWVREQLPLGSVVHVGGRSFTVASRSEPRR